MNDRNPQNRAEGPKNVLTQLFIEKELFLGTILIVVLITLVYLLVRPHKVTIESVIQVGKISGDSIESPDQVVQKINDDTYTQMLVKDGSINVDTPSNALNAISLNNTQLIKVTLKTVNEEKGALFLTALAEKIIKDHGTIFTSRDTFLKKDIIRLEKQQKIFEAALEKRITILGGDPNQIITAEYLGSQINYFDERITTLEGLVSGAENTKIVKEPTVVSASTTITFIKNIIFSILLGSILGAFIVVVKRWWKMAIASV